MITPRTLASYAHIPPGATFALHNNGSKKDKQHEIDMPNVNPNAKLANVTILHCITLPVLPPSMRN